MSPEKINLIKKNLENIRSRKKERHILKRITKVSLYFLIFFLLIITSLSYNVIFSDGDMITTLSRLPIVSQITDFVTGANQLAGERQDRINFLVLGQGGKGHEGPYLTDTIILISIKPSTGQVAIISIPRDLLVPIKNFNYQKINSANAIGETSNYSGGGSAFTAKVLEDIFKQPIHYWLRIDFTGFEKIIDAVGGIELYVERSFVDNQYPTNDFLTETVSFEKGWQHFDGHLALKFARSRYGNNNEGSDFARAKRQQKIILALKDKIFSRSILLNPEKIYSLYYFVRENIQTNIELDEIAKFVNLTSKIDLNYITQKTLDSSPQGLLIESQAEDGAFILIPRLGDYSELAKLAENIFLAEEINSQLINVIVENGTQTEGLARQKADEIVKLGFNVIFITNAPEQDYEKTVIYDVSQVKREKIISILKKYLDANVTTSIPSTISQSLGLNGNKINNTMVDYIVVLGKNAL